MSNKSLKEQKFSNPKMLNFKKLEEKWNSKKAETLVEIIPISNSKFTSEGDSYIEDNKIFVNLNFEESQEINLELAFKVQKAMKSVYDKLKKFGCVKVDIISKNQNLKNQAIYGLILVSYSYDFLQKKKSDEEFKLILDDSSEKYAKIAHAQNFARFLGDTPANLMTPVLFSKYAEEFLKEEENVEIISLNKRQIEDKNMGLLLGVNNGSVEEPRLVTMKYIGDQSDYKIKLAMVGKGVTFDTGGISLKPSAGMADMKYDMMGAATMLATFKLISQMKLKINVTATLAMVENVPSGSATKPGDVHFGMSGISVEVDNTDAEGRLILADALVYAQQDKPEYCIDAATLTGAMIVSLGNVYGGFFSNNNEFANLISKSSENAHELLWRLPLNDFYRESMKSSVADINNMGGKGAGSAKAAIFLKEFINSETKWAHFDIAGLMSDAYLKEVYGKTTTGRPVPAFFELAKNLE